MSMSLEGPRSKEIAWKGSTLAPLHTSHNRSDKYRLEIFENCNNEVLALDPRKDDKPIREFSMQWLLRVRINDIQARMVVADKCIARSAVATCGRYPSPIIYARE